MRKILSILIAAIITAFCVILGVCLQKTASPKYPHYDEVWIELNNLMPKPVRAWSCGIMKERTRALRAPLSCEDVWN